MRDLPDSFALLELARTLLLDDILPLVPPDRHRDLHLVATALSIAVRQMQAGAGWPQEIGALLLRFYQPSFSDQVSEAEAAELLARIAADLRKGEFETSPSRETAARAILWRMVAGRLREANPQFLAANGYK